VTPISQTLKAIFVKRQLYSSGGCSLPDLMSDLRLPLYNRSWEDLGYNRQPTNAVCCRASARVPLRVLQQATDDRFDVQTTGRLTWCNRHSTSHRNRTLPTIPSILFRPQLNSIKPPQPKTGDFFTVYCRRRLYLDALSDSNWPVTTVTGVFILLESSSDEWK